MLWHDALLVVGMVAVAMVVDGERPLSLFLVDCFSIDVDDVSYSFPHAMVSFLVEMMTTKKRRMKRMMMRCRHYVPHTDHPLFFWYMRMIICTTISVDAYIHRDLPTIPTQFHAMIVFHPFLPENDQMSKIPTLLLQQDLVIRRYDGKNYDDGEIR